MTSCTFWALVSDIHSLLTCYDCIKYNMSNQNITTSGIREESKMGYVLDLRRRVGHQPLVVAGAALMAQNSIGKIVLIYRTDNHCWGLPAGSTEPGETVQQTARRELKEETGLTVVS